MRFDRTNTHKMLSHANLTMGKPPMVPQDEMEESNNSRKRRRSSDEVPIRRRSVNSFSPEDLHVARKIALHCLVAETLVDDTPVDLALITTPMRGTRISSHHHTPIKHRTTVMPFATPSRSRVLFDQDPIHTIHVETASSAHFFATAMTKRRALENISQPLRHSKLLSKHSVGFVGCDLETLLQQDYVLVSGRMVVPRFMFYIVEWLKLNGLTQPGLFLNRGNSTKTNHIISVLESDQGGLTELFLSLSPSDALEVASVLVKFIANIPGGLIPAHLHPHLKAILLLSRGKKSITKSIVRLLRSVLLQLEVPHRTLLQYALELWTYCVRIGNKSRRDLSMAIGTCLFAVPSSHSHQPGVLTLHEVWQERVMELFLEAQEVGQLDQDVVGEGNLWTVSDAFISQIADRIKISRTPVSKRGSFSQSLAIMTPRRIAVLSGLSRPIPFGDTARRLFEESPNVEMGIANAPKFSFSFQGRVTLVGDVNREKFSKRRRIE
jgi:hypothetical protein